MTDGRDGIEASVRKFTDNVFLVTFTRVVMPVLLAVIGFLMITLLSDVKGSITNLQTSLAKVVDAQQSQAIDLAKVQVRVDDTSTSIKELKQQLNTLSAQVQIIKNASPLRGPSPP